MPTRGSISKRGKGPIRAEAEPDVTANHAPTQISRGAGVTLVVASLLGLVFVGWKAPSVLTTTLGFALALAGVLVSPFGGSHASCRAGWRFCGSSSPSSVCASGPMSRARRDRLPRPLYRTGRSGEHVAMTREAPEKEKQADDDRSDRFAGRHTHRGLPVHQRRRDHGRPSGAEPGRRGDPRGK